jgi:hypothetical protein
MRDLDEPEYECEGSNNYIGEGSVKTFDDLIIPAAPRTQNISSAGPFVGAPNDTTTTPP